MVDGLGGDEQLGGDLGVSVAGAEIRSSASCLRRIRSSGWARVAIRGPAGIDRMPRWRIFCPVIRAAAKAPRPMKIFTGLGSPSPRRYPCRATAAS